MKSKGFIRKKSYEHHLFVLCLFSIVWLVAKNCLNEVNNMLTYLYLNRQ